MEQIMTKITTILERDGEKLELVVEELISTEEFAELKIEMKRIQFESDLAKEFKENAAIIAAREKEGKG